MITIEEGPEAPRTRVVHVMPQLRGFLDRPSQWCLYPFLNCTAFDLTLFEHFILKCSFHGETRSLANVVRPPRFAQETTSRVRSSLGSFLASSSETRKVRSQW